ncbi:MAG: hypothetical protein PHP95_12410 [Desulfuromonadaceae bacterium]|nr:hypothetical protein [Desulfuromonadaceae bacterium]MDD2849246.1 hypothetical protein [Desulfuromonadaceae bacterium]MDD4131873.1 hypothetical protein [Desulfuromonadaceae bacterium]
MRHRLDRDPCRIDRYGFLLAVDGVGKGSADPVIHADLLDGAVLFDVAGTGRRNDQPVGFTATGSAYRAAAVQRAADARQGGWPYEKQVVFDIAVDIPRHHVHPDVL